MSSYLWYLLGYLDSEIEYEATPQTLRQRNMVLKEIRERPSLVDCRGLKITIEDEVATQKLSTFLKSYADVCR